jgi:sigma-B regulation protein RsbU (phosphoserine phosphatase)
MIQDQVDRSGEIHLSPGEILRLFNRVVFEATRGEMNMTASCIILNIQSGSYRYASAGHNPSYYLHAGTAEVNSMNVSGSRLGDVIDLLEPFDEASGTFEKSGDKIVLFTDGIQDLGVGDDALGRKGFKKFLQSLTGARGESIVASVVRDLVPLNQGAPLQDDITFLVIEQELNASS